MRFKVVVTDADYTGQPFNKCVDCPGTRAIRRTLEDMGLRCKGKMGIGIYTVHDFDPRAAGEAIGSMTPFTPWDYEKLTINVSCGKPYAKELDVDIDDNYLVTNHILTMPYTHGEVLHSKPPVALELVAVGSNN